nr:immunoglobulin heavy chain junction region [Mus musculus]MBK4190097.1 immunoglobulin heavy chain junction region [Mus musculus]
CAREGARKLGTWFAYW